MIENRESLRILIRKRLRNHKFVAVSNREPYMHIYRGGRVEWIRPASGVTVALDPVMRASRGVWVAHGSGAADTAVTDRSGFVEVPPDRPAYRLKRVWLSKEQEEGYYYGLANGALWPLCHVAYRRPVFRQDDWEVYRQVNRLFADSVAAEIGDQRAFIFIQDYHFALLPRMLRARCPRAVIAQFWHIPWPNPEVFRICPWKLEILEGMLGNHILGFHIRYHCMNFIDTVDRELEARPDREMSAIVFRGHTTKVRAFPISVDFDAVSRQAASGEVRRLISTLRRKYRIPESMALGVGADRIDYTKGLPERIDALDRLFERHPEYRGKVVFFQAGVPSRTQVPEYRRLDDEVEQKIAAINWKYGRGQWQPVIYAREHLDLPTLLALYRMARFLIVSSLHDGMNLVAKEFVAAQVDGNGVLVLSRFVGAARELKDALIINPFDADQTAERIREAIEMDPLEVRRRMGRLRERVRENNIYKWASDIIQKLSRVV
jgi:trehalose 6-phosphate synthase